MYMGKVISVVNQKDGTGKMGRVHLLQNFRTPFTEVNRENYCGFVDGMGMWKRKFLIRLSK